MKEVSAETITADSGPPTSLPEISTIKKLTIHCNKFISRLWGSLPLMWMITIATASIFTLYILFLSGLPWLLTDSDGHSIACNAGSFVIKRCWSFDTINIDSRFKIAAGAITGVAALTALLVSYRKQLNAESTQFNDQLAKAVELLANPSPIIRISGVYTISALADRTHSRQQECVDVLCGYMRLPCSLNPNDTALASAKETMTRNSEITMERTTHYMPYDKEVRNTIVSILREHLQADSRNSWSNLKLNFKGAYFFNADFRNSIFTKATFSESTFAFSAWFDNATFKGEAYFRKSTFLCSAWFKKATFKKKTSFAKSRFLQSAVFSDSQFKNEVDFRSSDFLANSYFSKVKFKSSPLPEGIKDNDNLHFEEATVAEETF